MMKISVFIPIIIFLILTQANHSSAQKNFKLNELPLIIKPGAKRSADPVFYLISGDGGWNKFDNSVCERLAQNGIPVVGLDSKKFFWKVRTPEETSAVMQQIIGYYNKQFERDSIVIAGYSFGADVVPFIISKFTGELKKKISHVILLSPDRYGDFEIHLTDMLNMGFSKGKFNVLDEIKKNNFGGFTCFFGRNEEAINIRSFRNSGKNIILLPGDHHYNNNYQLLAESIYKLIHQK